jgi:hypothetical protein
MLATATNRGPVVKHPHHPRQKISCCVALQKTNGSFFSGLIFQGAVPPLSLPASMDVHMNGVWSICHALTLTRKGREGGGSLKRVCGSHKTLHGCLLTPLLRCRWVQMRSYPQTCLVVA